jgi:hypothetical protein
MKVRRRKNFHRRREKGGGLGRFTAKMAIPIPVSRFNPK